MDHHSIYFSSTAQGDIFPNNTRSNFENSLNNLDHIKDENLEVAIRSITFDNSIESVKIVKQRSPDLISFEKINLSSSLDLMNFRNHDTKINFVTNKNESVQYNKNRQYIICFHGDNPKLLDTFWIQNEMAKFSSINIIFFPKKKKKKRGQSAYIMRNIYINPQTLKTHQDFVSLLNNCLSNFIFTSLPSSKVKIKENNIFGINLAEKTVLLGTQFFRLLEINKEDISSVTDIRQLSRMYAIDCKKQKYNNFKFKEVINSILDKTNFQFYQINNGQNKGCCLKLSKKEVYALQTNILKNNNFRNSVFDKIVSIFCVSSLEDNTVQINFLNPIFFKTNKSLMSQAQFKLIDTDTNNEPKFLAGSPTYIHAMTRPLKSYHHVKNVYLDSSCPVSKEMFKSNSNMAFRIKLAETFLLEGDWSICLKKLIIPASMNNIYKEYCTMKFRLENNIYTTDIHIESGHYPTITHLLEQIQHQIDDSSIPVQLNIINGKVMITHNAIKGDLSLSSSLANILGFVQSADTQLHQIQLASSSTIQAQYNPNLDFLLPKNIIVTTDVVESSIFAAQHVKILRLISNNHKTISSSPLLEFEFIHDEWVKLDIKSFETIQINILDVTGKIVESSSDLPSFLELQIIKLN